MANKYSKALKHIKSTQIDEKIKKLEEAAPTNSMSGVYALNAPGWHNAKPEPAKVFVPDKDGNWPAGIPANAGDKSYTRPAGYWDGGRDWDYIEKPVASNADIGADGKNTKNLIDDATGYVKTDLPDGTRGFVLGPLVDNFVYLHGYDAYCNIGYMQKDTRQFVLLGRVNGRWNTDVHPTPSAYESYGWGDPRVWDGSESGFTSYNPSFTHAHALWFKEQIESKRYGTNVAYFYSGGVPAQSNPGEYSNLPQWLQDLLNSMKGGLLAGLGSFMDANAAVAGAAASALGDFMGYGSGGDPNQVGIGKQHTQGDPTTGDSGDANLWGQLWDGLKGSAKKAWDFAKDWTDDGGLQGLTAGILNRGSKVLGDFIIGQSQRSPWMVKGLSGTSFDTFNFNKEAFTSFKGSGPKPNVGNWFNRQAGKLFKGRKLADFADDVVKGIFNPNLKFDPKFFKKLAGKNYVGQYFTDGTNFTQALDYAKDGVVVATERLNSAAGWKNWFGGAFSRSVKGEPEIFVRGADLANNKVFKVFDAADPKSVAKLKDLVTKGAKNSKWLGRAGRAVPVVGAIASAYDAYDRFQKGDTFGGVLSVASMMPGPVGWWALGAQVAYDVEGAVNKDGFKSSVKSTDDGLKKAARFVRGEEYIMEGVNSDTQVIPDIGKQGMYDALLEKGVPLNDPEAYAQQMAAVMIESGMNPELIHIIISAVRRKDFSPEDVEGIKASMMGLSMNLVAHRRKMEAGQDGRELNPNNPLSTEDEPWGDLESQAESVVLSESRSRILREIKKPVEVKEEPVQKLKKYRPNFKGKYRPQNTPDVTACKESDELAASGNAKGQAWRTKDKYWSGYETTERMNVIYDRVGHGNQAWDQIVEDARKKNGWKNREVQEQINRYYALEAERKQGLIQETSQTDREDNFDKVVKLKSIIGDLKTWQGDIKPEYPDEKPPKLEKGWHPQYGKDKFNYYKRLDSVSARAMPKTGDPEVDATVDKQKKKKMVQPKVAEDTRANWRDSLTNA